MGPPRLTPSDPFTKRQAPWCRELFGNARLCRKLEAGSLIAAKPTSSYRAASAKLQLDYRRFPLLRSVLSAPPPQPIGRLWRFLIAFSRLIKAADIDIKGMAMNGRRKGCHCREAQPLKPGQRPEDIARCYYRPKQPAPKGCNTFYKAGTEANARLEIRQVAGEDISRGYRFYVKYNQPVEHHFKGIGFLTILTDGFYGASGPHMRGKGPMCHLDDSLGPFGKTKKECDAYNDHFRVPLTGIVPKNWIRKSGHVVYALRVPFDLKRALTPGFLGSFGMTKRSTYRQLGIDYLTFPSRVDKLLRVVADVFKGTITHVNRNKPYAVTGQKPHIEWLDLHDATVVMLLRAGILEVPGIGKLTFKDGTRINARATDRDVTVTIRNPGLTDMTLPMGNARLAVKGISAGAITVVMPSVKDLISKRRTMGDATFSVEGIAARTVRLHDRDAGFKLDMRNVRIGRVALKPGGTLALTELAIGSADLALNEQRIRVKGSGLRIRNVTARSAGSRSRIRIGRISHGPVAVKSPLFDINAQRSSMRGITIVRNGGAQSLAIDRLSSDIRAGRIGGVRFGTVTLGEGRVGRCTITRGAVNIGYRDGVLTAEIAGMLDVRLNKTAGQRLDLNVPGLELSGTLRNIRITGPAHFTLTPNSWDLSRYVYADTEKRPLAIAAQLRGGLVVHNPAMRDARLRKNPHRSVIRTRMRIDSADLGIKNVGRISYLMSRHPDVQRARFKHMDITGAKLTNIVGRGRAWIKLPVWRYVSARFNKLRGNIGIGAIRVKSSPAGPQSKIRKLALDLKETNGRAHRCRIMIPLLKFSPRNYFIGDPDGKPMQLDCRFSAWLRGGYFHFRSKKRPLKHRRPYP